MLIIMKIFVSKAHNFQPIIRACNCVKSSWQSSELIIQSRKFKIILMRSIIRTYFCHSFSNTIMKIRHAYHHDSTIASLQYTS